MRVLAACSLGGSGHLNPLLPLLRAAEGLGHETLVAGPPALAELVEAAGQRFWPCGEPPESEVAPIRERLALAPPREASELANRELFGRLATAAMLGPMQELFDRWRPELVWREPCEYASAVLALAAGIPTHQVAVSLASVEAASIRVAAPALERWRTGLADELMASWYLSGFPASMDPSAFASTGRFHVAAGPVADDPGRWWPPVGGPRLYVSFGTVLGHMSIAADVLRTVLRAVSELRASVLFTVGRRFDPSELGPLPDHVRVEQWVEQSEALELADAVVCHGGSGTTFGALAAGVPVLAVPLFSDQFENARRVASAGAGALFERRPEARSGVVDGRDAPRLAEAIVGLLGDGDLSIGAKRVAGEIAATPEVTELVETVLAGEEPSAHRLKDG